MMNNPEFNSNNTMARIHYNLQSLEQRWAKWSCKISCKINATRGKILPNHQCLKQLYRTNTSCRSKKFYYTLLSFEIFVIPVIPVILLWELDNQGKAGFPNLGVTESSDMKMRSLKNIPNHININVETSVEKTKNNSFWTSQKPLWRPSSLTSSTLYSLD